MKEKKKLNAGATMGLVLALSALGYLALPLFDSSLTWRQALITAFVLFVGALIVWVVTDAIKSKTR